MQTPIYSIDKIAQVAQELAAAPVVEPQRLTHEQALEQLAPLIKELAQKNYLPKQIAERLRQSGVKVTIREVKQILQAPKTRQKRAPKFGEI